MTARIVRRGSGREHWHIALWRLILAALTLAIAWLILSSAAGAQQAPRGIGKLPGDMNFRPDRFLEEFFGKGDRQEREAQLAKVEISWADEAAQGRQMLDDLKDRLAAQNASLVERGRDVDYLGRLVGLVQPQMQQAQRYRKLDVRVATLDVPNACALPGGYVIVTRGMLDQAGCEAAMVCVLGHELAHLDRGHLLRRMKQWKLAQQRMAKPPTEFSFDALRDQMGAMSQLFRMPFGPEEELEADRDGITWAHRAGYDPRAVEQVYAAMENAGLSAPAFLPEFLRTHPQSAERRANLRESCERLRAPEAQPRLYLGRENLARRIARAQREFAE
jgi:predicted Zn-dependent protease